MAIDEAKLNVFMGNFVDDLGAVMHAATVVVGDQLGLYKALADQPATARELAVKTQTDERYLREWRSSQAASGYVSYEAASGRFFLSEERPRARRKSGCAWAPRRASSGCAMSPCRAASAHSAGAAQTPFNLIFEARP